MNAVVAASVIGVIAAAIVARVSGARTLAPGANRSAFAARMSRWLLEAGWSHGLPAYWGLCVVVGSAAAGVVVALTRAPVVAVVPAVGVALVPRSVLARRRAERARRIQTAWPDALRDIVAAVRAGRSLNQALDGLGRWGPEPIRAAFAPFPDLARVMGTAAALERLRDDLADATTDRVIEVLLVAHERGGTVVREILDDLVHATALDLRLHDAIEADGLEMRINSRAVLVLPWLVLVAMTARAGAFRDFYRSSAGAIVVVIAASMSIVGSIWLARLGRDEPEPRVLGRGAEEGRT